MDAVLRDAARKWAEPFFDDVIIYSETMEDHLEHLEDVFGRLDRAGLRINVDKVQLCRQRLKFLGYVIMPGMVKPDLKKVNAIANFPEPCSKRAVQQFLGLAGFYHKFVKDFAIISKPLSDLMKDVPWEWTSEASDAFHTIKDLLANAAGLRLPDLNRVYHPDGRLRSRTRSCADAGARRPDVSSLFRE